MKKLVLCIRPAPILFSLLCMGSLDRGKEGNRQKVMIGGPSYVCRPGSTYCKPNIRRHQIIVGPTKRTTLHPYTADALNTLCWLSWKNVHLSSSLFSCIHSSHTQLKNTHASHPLLILQLTEGSKPL
jgi:hypothetical protein